MSESINVSSPAGAYRADMRTRQSPFGADDDRWLAAASALHASATYRGGPNKEHLYDAIGIAIDVLGDDRIDEFVSREWLGQRSYIEALALLADQVQHAGALHLAALMFDDLLRAARDIEPLHRGRLLALRARVEWRLGREDEARERYQFVAALAQETDSAELEARAELGLSSIAQRRGNMPELRARSERVVQLAEAHGLLRLGSRACLGIMMAQSKAGNVVDAIRAGWRAFTFAEGDARLEVSALGNLGQILLEKGHPALARAAFGAVMLRGAHARMLLPALGGLALSSAQTGVEATVEWAVREVWRAQGVRGVEYELAEALLESGIGLSLLGRTEESRRYFETARTLAESHQFNAIVFRVDEAAHATSRRVPERHAPVLSPSFIDEVAALEPERLPTQLRFEDAPA